MCATTSFATIARRIHGAKNVKRHFAMDARIHSTVCPAKVVFVLFATREFVVPYVETNCVLRAMKRICMHVVYVLIPFARNVKFLQDVQSAMLVSAMNARSQ